MRIPENGLSQDEIIQKLREFKKDDIPWREGRTWAYIYDPGEEAGKVIKEAYTMFLSENALDPTVFPSLLKLETELVAMAAHHLNGDEKVVGNFTSGGTESIMLAVKAARDFFRHKKPQIKEPEIILPITAHAAFHKACHYLCLKPVLVPVDGKTFKADVKEIEKAITPNTIMLASSAVSYAHGVVDPIEEIGELALKNDLLFHVDACMGGFLLPYFRRLGKDIPPFDFQVPGVTSISMDFHKYAFAAKGASVILYRDKEIRKYQIFSCAHWTGYTVINPTIQSSRSGGPLAAAWAVLNFFGDNGYLEIARQVLKATEKIARAIENHPDLRLLSDPEMNLIAFTSDTIDVFNLIDEMRMLSWYIQPQLAFYNSKENIHLSINPSNIRWMDKFIEDLYQCVERAKKISTSNTVSIIKKLMEEGNLPEFDQETFSQFLALTGIKNMKIPKRMAEINQILNVLPPKLKEKILTEFFNELYICREGDG